ncbi:Myb-like DNA-binding domain protein, partial [Oesophagostomum dentatum]
AAPQVRFNLRILRIRPLSAIQVKIGADGRLVIDEDSLVVANEDTNESIWETVEEDRMARKVTSLSFRNRLWRKGTSWTEKENELFYEILRCTGPDFGLMHEFFPTRTRNELKSKFNREERTNWAKLKEVMSRPALLDDDLYDRAADLQKEIEEEALKKKMKKEKVKAKSTTTRRKRKKKDKDKDKDVEEESDQSDLLANEAEEVIRALEGSTMTGKKKRKRFWSYFSGTDSSESNGEEESDLEENEENTAGPAEAPADNAEDVSENACVRGKAKKKKRRKKNTIQSDSSEAELSESNAEEQPQQVQLRVREEKKVESSGA